MVGMLRRADGGKTDQGKKKEDDVARNKGSSGLLHGLRDG